MAVSQDRSKAVVWGSIQNRTKSKREYWIENYRGNTFFFTFYRLVQQHTLEQIRRGGESTKEKNTQVRSKSD